MRMNYIPRVHTGDKSIPCIGILQKSNCTKTTTCFWFSTEDGKVTYFVLLCYSNVELYCLLKAKLLLSAKKQRRTKAKPSLLSSLWAFAGSSGKVLPAAGAFCKREKSLPLLPQRGLSIRS